MTAVTDGTDDKVGGAVGREIKDKSEISAIAFILPTALGAIHLRGQDIGPKGSRVDKLACLTIS